MVVIGQGLGDGLSADMRFSSSAWVLEMGGLIFLLAGVLAILLGLLQRRGGSGGGRSVGYGVAMSAAAGISLYLSVRMGGTPTQTALEQAWLYPLTTIIGTSLYASHTFNQATKRGALSRNQRARSRAIAELHQTAGHRGMVHSDRPSARPSARGSSRHSARRSASRGRRERTTRGRTSRGRDSKR